MANISQGLPLTTYTRRKICCGLPDIVFFQNNEIFGVVIIVSTDTSDVSIFTDMVLKIFILSAIAALGVSVPCNRPFLI